MHAKYMHVRIKHSHIHSHKSLYHGHTCIQTQKYVHVHANRSHICLQHSLTTLQPRIHTKACIHTYITYVRIILISMYTRFPKNTATTYTNKHIHPYTGQSFPDPFTRAGPHMVAVSINGSRQASPARGSSPGPEVARVPPEGGMYVCMSVCMCVCVCVYVRT